MLYSPRPASPALRAVFSSITTLRLHTQTRTQTSTDTGTDTYTALLDLFRHRNATRRRRSAPSPPPESQLTLPRHEITLLNFLLKLYPQQPTFQLKFPLDPHLAGGRPRRAASPPRPTQRIPSNRPRLNLSSNRITAGTTRGRMTRTSRWNWARRRWARRAASTPSSYSRRSRRL